MSIDKLSRESYLKISVVLDPVLSRDGGGSSGSLSIGRLSNTTDSLRVHGQSDGVYDSLSILNKRDEGHEQSRATLEVDHFDEL